MKNILCVCARARVHMCLVYMCMCVHISVQVEARGHSSEAVHFGSGDRVSLLLPCKSKVSSWLCHPLTPRTPHSTRPAVQCFLRWFLVIGNRIQVRVFVHQHFMTELCRPSPHHTSDLTCIIWSVLQPRPLSWYLEHQCHPLDPHDPFW